MRSIFLLSIISLAINLNCIQAQIQLDNGLVAYLPLNGDGVDAGSQGNNLTLTNGVYPAASLTGV